MKRMSSLFVALALLVAALSLSPALSLPLAPAQAGSLVYAGELTSGNLSDDYPIALSAGETIEIQLDCAPGSPLDPYVEVYSSAMTSLDSDDNNGAPCINWYSAYLVFTAPATDTYIIRARGWASSFVGTYMSVGAYILTITGDSIAGAPSVCAPVNIPAGSVVGAFVSEAVAEWSPGKQTEPPVVFTPGKTAWVTGLNESGTHYQIAYGCNCLWVPVNSMGPNYDAVWNGAPLPTRTAGACGKPAFIAPASPSQPIPQPTLQPTPPGPDLT